MRRGVSCASKGAGETTPHRKSETDDEKYSRVPTVAMDYFFMSQDDRDADANPMLGMVDDRTGAVYLRAVGQKGILSMEPEDKEWILRDVSAELKS